MYVKEYFNLLCFCFFVLVNIHNVKIKRRTHVQINFLGFSMMLPAGWFIINQSINQASFI